MGLSASQARLLSITARLSDNELKSQMIANSKVRLADQTQEASEEYIEALSATKLMYTTYDANGNSTQVSLTPALIYEYSDLKNQYGISNTAGQLLVTSTDAKNFEASGNVNDFVQLYGVELTDNPKYYTALQSLYGADYADFFDLETAEPSVNFGGLNVLNWVSQPNTGMTENDYQAWASQISQVSVSGKESGYYGSLISKLTDVPDYPGNEPQPPEQVDMPDFAALATSYNNSVCYSSVSSSSSGIGHMEHNLAELIWSISGLGTDTNSITNSSNTITIINKEAVCGTSYGFSLSNYSYSATGKGESLLEALRAYSDYDCVQELIQSIIDLYCDVINYMSVNNTGSSTTDLDQSAFTMSSTASVKSASELYSSWQQMYADLAALEETGAAEYEEKYAAEYEQYEIDHANWVSAWEEITSWQTSCTTLYNKYIDALASLPAAQIPDEDDPKTQWYVNLWHRMNGESDYKSQAGKIGTYYKQLDDSLLTSADWLKFALEHGVVTMEKVQFVYEAEEGTGLINTTWQSAIYTTCVDISEVDDEIAIAKAEAQYNKKLNEIEAKDKKYDNDIKKLDTEHNAMQTEYESIQSVIEKNIERSFKAFS